MSIRPLLRDVVTALNESEPEDAALAVVFSPVLVLVGLLTIGCMYLIWLALRPTRAEREAKDWGRIRVTAAF